MKGLILYKSKYGSTKQLAQWLKNDTGYKLFEISDAPADLKTYDKIVIGTRIHGGQIELKNWIVQNWEKIKDKEIVLMLTSGTADSRFLQRTLERSLPQDISRKIKLFPVGGRYLFNKMSLLDRVLIKVVASFIKHPETKKGMLTERDDVKRENLRELIGYLKK